MNLFPFGMSELFARLGATLHSSAPQRHYRESGHMASNCPNEGICHSCSKTSHHALDCQIPMVPPGDARLCNNCFKPGHIAADCSSDKASKNCRNTGHRW